jgi:hypothetical protein
MKYIISNNNYKYDIPETTTEIIICDGFNQSLDNVILPNNLQSITFGFNFNQSLDNVNFPSSLQSIIFGFNFNQSLDNVDFPSSLEIIEFGDNFYQNLLNVKFPLSLQSLTFKNYRNNQMNPYLELDKVNIYMLNQPITNLPININKIILLNIYRRKDKIRKENITKSKIPFGCQVIYE